MRRTHWTEQRRQARITRTIEVAVLGIGVIAITVAYVLSALSYYPVR
jgi:phosphoglycerate dehydrogenase-like enzyme